ncbi:Protein translocase subunit SecA [Koleobacter methoxysyntrophicus]|uniref:Protein translocase subunit SecA n=1 Tax=Koleobacter methoxysyntrophicus TaxID=2751313 RepID=A0A8A0RR66_9FIRM|nr:preprotein translocase subunit SecA [Koleobacter methoxysyntrophicus]QSQ10382.1 Protein translocase subunit SecA [Koleobacter methoxysyntrophicus]
MLGLLKNIFGNYNDREIKKLSKIVEVINNLEPEVSSLTDVQLKTKTGEFRERLDRGAALDDILPEAFAVVRETAKRTLGMRHFDVQILGGIVLHQGRIAEMKTGEGKTLVATLPAYLNALEGKGVHIVTVNDYLAKRDSQWMGEVYRFLGLDVGLIIHGLDFEERKKAYNAHITYGTNNEFGFDYLRDNMVLYKEHMVQRELNYAIIDEVDSILIDEARTPLIISGQTEQSTDIYYNFARFVPRLKRDVDYTVDEKAHSVVLTEEGIAKAERFLNIDNLYDERYMELAHHLNQALKAHVLMKRDRDYVVKDGQVIIVDEFTGRLMFGRRYSEGLHQAIEAKEGVRVERESQTLATITFQNYFRMYKKLAGMTGTAATEEEEFQKIYGLDVVVIPTNEPMIRKDYPDVIYKTEAGKFKAVVEEIIQCHSKGQPVLVGTVSIEKSELLSEMLRKRGIPHQVLNAKHHEKEAEIIAKAGQRGMVTIATNMAGRGTDIVLGDGVAELGGLHIIGTERHESRRIDNQLRGRAGRQGDPGSSRFYVSLEDDLMRLFGGDNIKNIMERLGMDDDQPIEHPLITRSIENAQKRVEARNFDIRKHVLEYDDVMNKQREVIYSQRKKVLEGENLKESILGMIEEVISNMVDTYCVEGVHPEEWDLKGLIEYAEDIFLPRNSFRIDNVEEVTREELKQRLVEKALALYESREKELGSDTMREFERVITLKIVDKKWMDHIDAMDQLRQGIGLRAYGQRDPVMEYKFEGYEMFKAMIRSIQEDTVKYLFKAQVQNIPQRHQVVRRVSESQENTGRREPVRNQKVGRNDPCPCGSGKKYKKCCGR